MYHGLLIDMINTFMLRILCYNIVGPGIIKYLGNVEPHDYCSDLTDLNSIACTANNDLIQ